MTAIRLPWDEREKKKSLSPAQPALEFPTSEIVAIENRNLADGESSAETRQEEQPLPIDIEVAFWGLIGSVGALPNHYTQLVIDRVKSHDHAMHDFLGMFSHRQLSFFYRSWEKYFVPAGFERGQLFIERGDSIHLKTEHSQIFG